MELSEKEVSELQALESKLLQADTRHSTDKLSKLIADEFQEFGSSGKVYNKAQTLATLSQETGKTQLQMSQFHARRLAQNLALVTYRIHKTSTSDKESHSLHSSIWRQTRNGWRILFHQGTPATAPSDATTDNG